MVMTMADHISPNDEAVLKALLAESEADNELLKQELQNRDMMIEKLRLQLATMRRDKFGTSSESLDQTELKLESDEIAAGAAEQIEAVETAKDNAPSPKHPGRKPLPEALPRFDTLLSPGEACSSCGGKLKELGTEITEELEYVPGQYRVNRIIRPRMACSCCERVFQKALPSRPIEKGRPGPGLLAHILVSKYADHLPLYRQAAMLQRQDIDLDRSTLANWVGKSATLLEPVADAIGRHVLKGPAIFTDDTPVDVLAPGRGKTKTARLWSYVRDETPWKSDTPAGAWYQFSPDRKAIHPKEHLANYRGFMHADGYAGYREICSTGRITEVACMAHIRRKFHDIFKANGSAMAEEALKRIAMLYAIEKDARHKPPDERHAIRQARAKPVLDDLEQWLQNQLLKISGKSPLAAAIRYALSRMPHVRPYLDHGILELDNNAAERSMRCVALGRKNYLFMGSQTGGKSAAIAYTLIETCKLNGVNPQVWLTDVLSRIADHKVNRLDELMPWHYTQHG